MWFTLMGATEWRSLKNYSIQRKKRKKKGSLDFQQDVWWSRAKSWFYRPLGVHWLAEVWRDKKILSFWRRREDGDYGMETHLKTSCGARYHMTITRRASCKKNATKLSLLVAAAFYKNVNPFLERNKNSNEEFYSYKNIKSIIQKTSPNLLWNCYCLHMRPFPLRSHKGGLFAYWLLRGNCLKRAVAQLEEAVAVVSPIPGFWFGPPTHVTESFHNSRQVNLYQICREG